MDPSYELQIRVAAFFFYSSFNSCPGTEINRLEVQIYEIQSSTLASSKYSGFLSARE